MYDRGKDLNWKAYKDIGFLAAMGKVCNIVHFMNVVHLVKHFIFQCIQRIYIIVLLYL